MNMHLSDNHYYPCHPHSLIQQTSSKLSASLLNDSSRTLEDSEDSDLEDFHHVIHESLKALNFTCSTLSKFQKEPVDPAEYVSLANMEGSVYTPK